MPKIKRSPTVNILLIHSNTDEDKKYVEQIRKRLHILKRSKPIDIQDVNEVSFGKDVPKEIEQMSQDAHIILILLSSDLLANSYSPSQKDLYYYDIAAQSVECHTDKVILPILLRDVDIDAITFLECVDPSIYSRKPISHYANTDKVYTEIKQNIEDAIDEVRDHQSGDALFKRFSFSALSEGFVEIVGQSHPHLLNNIQKVLHNIEPMIQKIGVKIEKETGYFLTHLNDIRAIWLYGLLIKNSAKPSVKWESNLSAPELYTLYLASCLFPIGLYEAETSLTNGNNEKTAVTTRHYTEKSYNYIMKNWQELGIYPSYAEPIARLIKAIGLKDLDARFTKDYHVDFHTSLCLPFLARLLQLAHLLDIANILPNTLLGTQHLPHIDKSKERWLKDTAKKSLMAPKSRGDVILLRRQCEDQNIYNALTSYAKELQNQINRSLKTVAPLDKEFPIKAVINAIQPSNFPAHNIGFTLDEENIFEAFIGERLYSNKFVALREVLQNAIDACNHRQKIEPFYRPKITVCLDKDQLIVMDNGLGMDADIVEHYFAKLGRSYYIHGNGKKIFNNAIAQFGVGVFSYFLIADSFYVETRKTGHPSLSFRVDKDPNIHFYFYNDAFHVQDGTKISLQLKEELEDVLDFEELVYLVKHYVPYPNIEIVVKQADKQVNIQKEAFHLSYEKDVLPLLKILGKRYQEQFHLIKAPIKNTDFEGQIGLVIAEEGHKKMKDYLAIYDYLEPEFTTENPVLVAQKGILVTEKVDFTFFKTLIGSLNLIKGFPLRMHRNELNNKQHLVNILNRFQAKVIEQLFDHWGDLSAKAKAKNTETLYSYINYRYGIFSKPHNTVLRKAICKHFYITVVDDKQYHYVAYEDLPKFFEQLIPINTKHYKGDLRVLAKNYNSALLLTTYDHLIVELLSLDYEGRVVVNEGQSYGVFHLQQQQTAMHLVKHKNKRISFCVPFEQTQYLTTHIIGAPYSLFNVEHPIVQWYIKHQKYVAKDRLLKQYFEQFFSLLDKISGQTEELSAQLTLKVLQSLNGILKKINQATTESKHRNIKGTAFLLSTADFPLWMTQEIIVDA